jgi:hypothetical protein
MENRIKEAQGDLFADRTSAATMRANQLRLWFASMRAAPDRSCSYPVRSRHLRHDPAEAAEDRALVKISARRVKIAFTSACPPAAEWRLAAARLAHSRRLPS